MKKLLLSLFSIIFINLSCLAFDDFFVEENAFKIAETAFKEGDFKKAFEIWSNRAESGILDWYDGDPDSQYELGNMYLEGTGVVKDYKKALYWFKKAANRDNAKAQYKYGLMHFLAYGVKQNNKKALSWILKSSEQGNSDAEAWLKSFPVKNVYGLAKEIESRAKEIELKKQESIPKLDYGNYYALVIGNDDYLHLKPLSNAVNDANDVASMLRSKYQFNVQLLTNVTRDEIVTALSKLRKTVSAKDNILIYYAGHGYLDKDQDEGFWWPIDATDNDQVHWVSNETVMRSVRAMKAKHVIVVADSCFSGTLTRGVKVINKNPDYINEILQKKARTVLTSGGLEPVSDVGGGNNSVFAASFLRTLNENSGVMNGHELFIKIRKQVMQNTKDQTPEYGDIRKAGHDGGDFLFVRQ